MLKSPSIHPGCQPRHCSTGLHAIPGAAVAPARLHCGRHAGATRLNAVEQAQQQPSSTASIRIGARSSKLAQLQAEQVSLLLRKVKPEWTSEKFSTVTFTTHGDENRENPLRQLGQGAFTEVIDQAVAAGSVDIGVHSLKDSPVSLPEGVDIAACLPRDDPRDALISLKARTLADLPHGARVGTSSLRRKAQLLHSHPHLNVVPVRGNIDTRLKMLETGELDAIVLAAAGLSRLGQQSLITRVLDFDEMLPAACQGAVGVTCSKTDPFIRWELGLICHEPTRFEVAAERAVLTALLNPPKEDESSGSDADSAASSSSYSSISSSDSDSGGSPSNSRGRGSPSTPPPTSAPSLKGISSVTGLPMLPSFAIACHAAFDSHEGMLKVEGLVASEDGRTLHRLALTEGVASPGDAEEVGLQLGRKLRELAQQHGWLDE